MDMRESVNGEKQLNRKKLQADLQLTGMLLSFLPYYCLNMWTTNGAQASMWSTTWIAVLIKRRAIV